MLTLPSLPPSPQDTICVVEDHIKGARSTASGRWRGSFCKNRQKSKAFIFWISLLIPVAHLPVSFLWLAGSRVHDRRLHRAYYEGAEDSDAPATDGADGGAADCFQADSADYQEAHRGILRLKSHASLPCYSDNRFFYFSAWLTYQSWLHSNSEPLRARILRER